MELLELMKERFSVRSFKTDKVEKEKLEKILLAAKAAPTAVNNQPVRLLVIESEEALGKLKECTASHYNSPLAILCLYDQNSCWVRSFDAKKSGEVDASIVCTHMMLEAWELGVGSVWVMHFDPVKIREVFAIPENLVPVSLLVMGYPSEDCQPNPRHSQRKELTETVFYNKF